MQIQSTSILLLSILLIFCQCEGFNISKYDFLNQTYKPYCISNILTQQQIKNDLQQHQIRSRELSTWVPLFGSHLVQAIVLLCNRKYEKITEIINNLLYYSFIYSQIILLGLALLIILFFYWIYTLLKKPKQKNSHKTIGYQFTNQIQIALAIFVISLLIVISISSYGLVKSQKISRTINGFWCRILKQEHGYININNEWKGRMVDYALELNKVTASSTRGYQILISTLQYLKKTSINQSPSLNNSNSIKKLNTNSDKYSEAVTSLTVTLQRMRQEFIYFNDTLQYQRQVMIGFTFVIGNIDKYGNRYIGFANISTFIQGTVQFLLTSAIFSSFFSIVMVGHIMIKEKINKIYVKYIIQYILASITFFTLIFAIVNSSFVIIFYSLKQSQNYLMIGNNPRGEFITTGSLNDPLVEIMTNFWPQSSGNITDYGNKSLLGDISLLNGQLALIHTQLNPNPNNSTNQYSKQLLKFKSQLTLFQSEMQLFERKLLEAESKLNPTAFDAIYIHFFNRADEFRQIFGFLSLFLILALLSSGFIGFSYKLYVKTNEIQPQNSFYLQRQNERRRKDSNEYLQKIPGDD